MTSPDSWNNPYIVLYYVCNYDTPMTGWDSIFAGVASSLNDAKALAELQEPKDDYCYEIVHQGEEVFSKEAHYNRWMTSSEYQSCPELRAEVIARGARDEAYAKQAQEEKAKRDQAYADWSKRDDELGREAYQRLEALRNG